MFLPRGTPVVSLPGYMVSEDGEYVAGALVPIESMAYPDQKAAIGYEAVLGVPYEDQPLPHILTKLEFRNRFSLSEKIVLDSPELVIQDGQALATIKTILKDFDAASYIDLSRKDTIEAIKYLVYLGLITPARELEIRK